MSSFIISKKYIPAIGLSSIIFLWAFQIKLGSSGIPTYFIFNILLYFIYGFETKEIRDLIVLTIGLYLLTFIQTLGKVELTTPLRTLFGIPLFTITIVICSKWLIKVKDNIDILFRVFKYFIFLQLFYQLVQVVLWYLNLYHVDYLHYLFKGPRVSGFFREPSHVAFSLSPFAYLIVFKYKYLVNKLGKLALGCLFLVYFLSLSSTLIGVFLIGYFFRFLILGQTVKSFIYRIIGIIILIISFSYLLQLLPALKERVDLLLTFFDSTRVYKQWDNMSVLALIKGWQMATAALANTVLGAGFLNLQYFNEYSEISKISETLYHLNKWEGTSIAFKIIGEYGYLGVLLIINIFFIFFKNCNKTMHFSVFQNLFLFGIIGSFIRGASYFDGVVIITLALIFLNFQNKV